MVFSPPTVGRQGPNSINNPVNELHPGPPIRNGIMKEKRVRASTVQRCRCRYHSAKGQEGQFLALIEIQRTKSKSVFHHRHPSIQKSRYFHKLGLVTVIVILMGKYADGQSRWHQVTALPRPVGPQPTQIKPLHSPDLPETH